MKFIHYLEKVKNIDTYGLTSLLIFVLFFSLMTLWVIRTKKRSFNEISRIPLDNQE